MNIKRVWAIVLKYLGPSLKNFSRIFTILYWLVLNIIIWGSTSVWLQQQSHIPKLINVIICGLVFWQVVFRVNLETAKSLFDEIISLNLINIFSSPLRLREWILGIMILGLIDACLILFFGFSIAWYIYKINPFDLGINLIYSMLLLIMSGWFIGFLICGILMVKGKRAQDLVYSLGYIFAPFSCIYYPLSSLTGILKFISSLLPMTYVFENMRIVLISGQHSTLLLTKALILNIIYLTFSLAFFTFMFNKAQKNSLSNI